MNVRRAMVMTRITSRAPSESSGDFLSGIVGGVFILGVVLVGFVIGAGRSA